MEDLAQWLADLGLPLQQPWSLRSTFIAELADGCVLCRLVQKLEHVRGGLAGVEWEPKTGAARLQNIRRALELLRQNPAMPVDHLWSEHALREGSTAVWVPLLRQLNNVYGKKRRKGKARGTRRIMTVR